MKKISLLIVLSAVACTSISEISLPEIGATNEVQVEEAFPDIEKEIYLTRSGIELSAIDTLRILQGDMMLSPEQVAVLDDPQTRGAIIAKSISYWGFCNIYYDFAPDFIYRTQALEAMENISAIAGVRFTPKGNNNKNYVHFFHGAGNYSNVGQTGGKQDISILTNQGNVVGIIMHEILHALGLFHEMSRADRDDYVNILWDNIETNKKHNFQTYLDQKIPGSDIGTFDFNSIMMYPSKAFGKVVNDRQLETIVRKDGNPYTTQRIFLSDSDIQAIQAIYGPPYVRVEREVEVIQLREDFDYYYEANVHTYACFYEDKEYTIPATLTTPRYLNIRYMQTNVTTQYSTVIVPEGTSCYYIGQGYSMCDERWNMPAIVEEREYGIVNCHDNGYN